MTRYQSLTIYAALIMLTGVAFIILSISSIVVMQQVIAIGSILSGIFAGITTYKCRSLQIARNYHALHTFGFLSYGIVLLSYATTALAFIDITTFFLLFYAFAEMIFAFQRLMVQENTNFKKDLIRFVIAVGIIIGVVIVLLTSTTNTPLAYIFCGLIFIGSGVNLILFKAVLKIFDNQTGINQLE